MWPDPGVLVGRDTAVGVFDSVLDGLTAGHGRAVLVEGEPGVGKTALLDAIARRARRIGAHVRRGAATEPDLPFAAITQWLYSEPALLGEDGLTGPDHSFTVTESVLDAVDRWSAAGPVVLVIDDLHRADPSSLLVLARLGRALPELRLVLAFAYQPDQSGPELDALRRGLADRGAAVIRLEPLTASDVVEVARAYLGGPPGADLTQLLAGAGGNPFYLTELLKALVRQGSISFADGVTTLAGTDRRSVPRSLVELILHRLGGLSPVTRELLREAAILGTCFDVAELAAVLGRPVIALWQPVEEAVAAGLLIDGGAHLVFRHELIRAALADGIPVEVRAALHLRAGRALVALGTPAERVAQHLVAGSGLDRPLLDWLVGAADSLTVRAPALAAELLGRARTETGGLRYEYARALLWAGRPADAEGVARDALAASAGDLRLHWLLGQILFQQGRVEDALAAAESVLADPALPAAAGAQFHGFAAQCLLLAGQVDAADRAATAALDAAGDQGIGYGYTVRAAIALLRGSPEPALELADRTLALLADQDVQPDRQQAPHLIRAFCLLELDRSAEAEAAAEQGRLLAERSGGAFLGWYTLLRVRMRFLDGQWDDALAGVVAGEDLPDPLGVAAAVRSQAALIALHRGDASGYADLLGRRDTSLGGRHWAHLRLVAQCLHWEQEGRPDRALEALSHAWQRTAVPALAPDLARLAAVSGQRRRIQAVAVALERLASRHPGPHVAATAALCRGVASADPEPLCAAGKSFVAINRPLYAGWAYEQAAVLLAEGADPAGAREALDAALDCYRLVGAAWDRERAETRLRRVGIRRRQVRSRPKTGWEALTDTERRIAAMVAAGRSNPDIAAELFLSRRTVRNHVSHILAKLELGSRVELAVHTYDQRSL